MITYGSKEVTLKNLCSMHLTTLPTPPANGSGYLVYFTLPETKTSFENLKTDGWNTSSRLGYSIFRAMLFVSGRVTLASGETVVRKQVSDFRSDLPLSCNQAMMLNVEFLIGHYLHSCESTWQSPRQPPILVPICKVP